MIDSLAQPRHRSSLRDWVGRGEPLRDRTKVVLAGLCMVMLLGPGDAANAAATSPVLLPEVPVTAIDLASQRAQNSPVLAADPTESRFLALASRVDAPEFNCALHVSGDAGRSWRPANPVRELPAGAERCYAPEVAFDGDGTLYFLFVGLHTRGNTPMGVFLSTSVERREFGSPRRVLGANRYQVRMAVEAGGKNEGRIHLVWLEPSSPPPLGGLPPGRNPLMYAYSDDGGHTLSAPVQVSDPKRRRVVAPALALGANGAVHVAYYDLEDDAVDYQGLEGPVWAGTWSLVVSTSVDGGRSFDRHDVAASGLAPPERVMLIFTMAPPSFVADDAGGLFLSWWDARNGDWDVFVGSSSDAGRSWREPVRLNDDTLGNGRHQYLPQLSLADGRLDAIFYDRRDDSTNLNNHVYYTFSNDGGRHFAPNRRLTSEISHSGTGARYIVPSADGMVEFGSRLALTSGGTSAVAAWTDTRNVRWGSTHQDVFASRVEFAPDSPSNTVPAVLFVASGVAVAAVCLVVARRRVSSVTEVREH